MARRYVGNMHDNASKLEKRVGAIARRGQVTEFPDEPDIS
jgi:hypothetical protein